MFLAPEQTQVAKMTTFIEKMRLPRPSRECIALLEKAGFEPSRGEWRVTLAKRRCNPPVESYRVEGGWGWRRRDAGDTPRKRR